MISRLSGVLLEKQAPFLLIDVAGVGYEVQAPMTSFYPLPAVGQPVVLHTHLSVSENAQQLFAFYSLDERRLFRALIRVSGVGPKMALAILSGLVVEEFVQCVTNNDVASLVKVPGVGKKTAERLIVEMRDGLKDWLDNTTQTASPRQSVAVSNSTIIADAESALIALGYRPTEVNKMIQAIPKIDMPTTSEALIKLVLKRQV